MWPHPERPWYGVFVARQMRSLSSAGVEVDVMPIYGAGSPIRSAAAYVAAALKVLALNFRTRRYDLIHAHTGHCGLLACLQIRYPVVMSYVGYDLDITADRPDNLRLALERRGFQQLSRLLAATIAKSRRGRARVPESSRARNAVIPNGVDRSLFAPIDRAESRRRLEFGDDERPWALFPADPARYNKRFELAEAAVAAARRRVPELQLKVANGVLPELVPVWMNAADVMVMSSRAEGSANIVKEAMACNLPIVGVDVGDTAEVIEGTRHCHVCQPNPEAMGAAIEQVVRAIPERSNGRERSEHLGLEPVAQQVREVYEQALTRGPGPFGFLRSSRRSVPASTS